MKLPVLVRYNTNLQYHSSLDLCKSLGGTGYNQKSPWYPAYTPMLLVSYLKGRSTFYLQFITPEGNTVWLGTYMSPQESLKLGFLETVP